MAEVAQEEGTRLVRARSDTAKLLGAGCCFRYFVTKIVLTYCEKKVFCLNWFFVNAVFYVSLSYKFGEIDFVENLSDCPVCSFMYQFLKENPDLQGMYVIMKRIIR